MMISHIFLEVQKQYYPISKFNLVVILYDIRFHMQMTNIDQNIKKLHYIFERLKCSNNIVIMDFSCYSYGCNSRIVHVVLLTLLIQYMS
jgi:hypothetical protein